MSGRARDDSAKSVASLLAGIMPAQYAKYAGFEKLSDQWEQVVGPVLAEGSGPSALSDGILLVVAESQALASRLNMMRGNIARRSAALSGLEVNAVKISLGRKPLRRVIMKPTRRMPPRIKVSEEEVAALKEDCEKVLPQDAADALARLRAYFEKRFPRA